MREGAGQGPQHLLQHTMHLNSPTTRHFTDGEGLFFFSLILNIRRDKNIIQKLDGRPLRPFGDNGCDIGRSTEVWFWFFCFVFIFTFFFF